MLHASEYNWDIWVVLPALQGSGSGGTKALAEHPVAMDFVLSIKDLDNVPWKAPLPPPPARASWSTRAWAHLCSFPLLQEGLRSHPIVMRMEVACSTCLPWKHPPQSCSSKCPFRCWEYLSQDKWIKSWQPAIKKHLVPVFTSLCLSPETLHCQERHQLEWPEVKCTWKICEIAFFWMAFLLW